MVWGQPNRKLSSSWPPLECKEIQHCEISQMRLIVYKHNFWLKHFQDQGWQQLREQGIHAKAQTEDPHKFRISELQDVLCIWRWLSLQESSHPRPPALLPHLNFRVHLWKNWSQQGKLQTQLLKLDTRKLNSPHDVFRTTKWTRVGGPHVSGCSRGGARSQPLFAGRVSVQEREKEWQSEPGATPNGSLEVILEKTLSDVKAGKTKRRCKSSLIPTPFKPWSRGVLPQLYLRSSGLRPQRWGSPGLWVSECGQCRSLLW